MPLTLTQIITEADILVPNSIASSDKIIALNGINQDFFNIVKIPKMARFTSVANQTEYTLASDVREKNIDLVHCGMLQYVSLDSNNLNPLQNHYSFDDTTLKLLLSSAPYKASLQGTVRYRRIATTSFTTSNLGVSPDAPEEYHWTYIPALAAFFAETQDDAAKATYYDNQAKNAWNTAAQNFL